MRSRQKKKSLSDDVKQYMAHPKKNKPLLKYFKYKKTEFIQQKAEIIQQKSVFYYSRCETSLRCFKLHV